LDLNKRTFETQIAAGERLLLDLSVLIAYFESTDERHDVAVGVIDDFVQGGRNPAIVAAITAMDFLVKPLRSAPRSVIHIHDFLTHWPNLSVVAFDLNIAQTAASLRASHDFNSPDALVVATGIVGEADHLLSSDPEWSDKLAALGTQLTAAELAGFI
jgi:predicted nucleic acid-binding protein